LQGHLDIPLNIVNVRHMAEQRGIRLESVMLGTPSDDSMGRPQLAIIVKGPPGAVTAETAPPDQVRRIVGRVYQDMRPRVVEINGYHMDMIPTGCMVLIQNQDRPGVIGLVGTEFGKAQVNIADMAISRRGTSALMVLKVDNDPPESLINDLRTRPGIMKVAVVKLTAEK
jgi:D-3-phosphoglycerate dehydrogenase